LERGVKFSIAAQAKLSKYVFCIAVHPMHILNVKYQLSRGLGGMPPRKVKIEYLGQKNCLTISGVTGVLSKRYF